MVFLADVGYELSSHTEIEAFVKSLSQLRDRQGARRAMLFMDSDIPYSEIVFIIEKIRRAGLDGISFVERVQ